MSRRRGADTRALIGRDLAHARRTRIGRRRVSPGIIAGALIGGLLLAALRVEIIHLGYALGDALKLEKGLQEEQRVLTAKLASLRDPARLRQLASELGLDRADHVIELVPLEVARKTHPMPHAAGSAIRP